jgi:glycosyltransferase involved in cell wall biosynthesis
LGTLGEWNPVSPLIDLLEAVTSNGKSDPNKLRVIHVGNCDENFKTSLERIRQLGLEVITHGLQPRDRTIELLSSSHCIFQSLSLGSGKGLTTARIFDSLASGRPIIAFGDQGGEVDLLLAKTGNALRFDNQSIDTAANYLVDLIEKWNSSTLSIIPRPAYAEPYRWDNIAGQFAKLFESLI